MKLSTDRIITIITIMYGQRAELVVDHSRERCYLFFDGLPQDLEIYYEEVDCLEYNQIIEIDSGCAEKGHETSVYTLTVIAKQRMKEIIKDSNKLRLKP